MVASSRVVRVRLRGGDKRKRTWRGTGPRRLGESSLRDEKEQITREGGGIYNLLGSLVQGIPKPVLVQD